ncbi:MAG: DUF3578 domain-containing protein, partial [Methanobacteriaceae archaeon]|nr:DUF3578 domain-containing protein [Methanobacteriaceae archaeon]
MDLDKLKSEIIKYQKDFEDEFNESKKDFNEFLRLYPFKENPEKIDSLTKDDIFKKGHSSFLYYIEFKLKDFGRIRLGSAKYAYNARNQIDDLKILLKIAVEDSLPISKKLDAPWDKIPYWKGDRQIAKKIIYCYNPNKVMPIYNTAHLEHFAYLFNENYDSQANKYKKHYDDLTLGEKFEYLNEIILEFKKENIPLEIDNVAFMHFLYKFYPPGSSIQIESFLKYVFKYYNGLKEQKKPVANSKASKVFRNFADDLKNYSEHILEKPKNVLSSKAIYHTGGTWVNSPYVWLDDLELRNNKFNAPPFFVRYSFESERRTVHLMLKVNWSYAKHYLEDIKGKFDEEDRNNYFKSKSEELRKKLIRAGKLPEDSYNYSNPSIIYSKSYEKNNLPSEEELKSDLIKILNLYGDLVELDSSETLSQFLEIILKNYNKKREEKVSDEEKASIRDFLATKLPEKLSEITQSKYKTFSSAWDKWQYCPYVALMNEEITIKHTEGYFVNYMFREDMSGVYLALRQGINDIHQSNYKEKLIAKSEGYRQTQSDNEISKFSEEIDLKSAEGAYSEFYEAGNIYAKFYPADNLPSEEEMIIDLEKMLEIYDYLSEIITIEYPSFNEYLKDKNFLYTP